MLYLYIMDFLHLDTENIIEIIHNVLIIEKYF